MRLLLIFSLRFLSVDYKTRLFQTGEERRFSKFKGRNLFDLTSDRCKILIMRIGRPKTTANIVKFSVE